MPKNSGLKKTKKRISPGKHWLFFCSCCAAALLLFLSGANLRSVSDNRVLGSEDEVLEEEVFREISFWEDFLTIHPSYFDGWLELSSLMLSAENKDGASVAFGRAQEINPNSEKLEGVRFLLER